MSILDIPPRDWNLYEEEVADEEMEVADEQYKLIEGNEELKKYQDYLNGHREVGKLVLIKGEPGTRKTRRTCEIVKDECSCVYTTVNYREAKYVSEFTGWQILKSTARIAREEECCPFKNGEEVRVRRKKRGRRKYWNRKEIMKAVAGHLDQYRLCQLCGILFSKDERKRFCPAYRAFCEMYKQFEATGRAVTSYKLLQGLDVNIDTLVLDDVEDRETVNLAKVVEEFILFIEVYKFGGERYQKHVTKYRKLENKWRKMDEVKVILEELGKERQGKKGTYRDKDVLRSVLLNSLAKNPEHAVFVVDILDFLENGLEYIEIWEKTGANEITIHHLQKTLLDLKPRNVYLVGTSTKYADTVRAVMEEYCDEVLEETMEMSEIRQKVLAIRVTNVPISKDEITKPVVYFESTGDPEEDRRRAELYENYYPRSRVFSVPSLDRLKEIREKEFKNFLGLPEEAISEFIKECNEDYRHRHLLVWEKGAVVIKNLIDVVSKFKEKGARTFSLGSFKWVTERAWIVEKDQGISFEKVHYGCGHKNVTLNTDVHIVVGNFHVGYDRIIQEALERGIKEDEYFYRVLDKSMEPKDREWYRYPTKYGTWVAKLKYDPEWGQYVFVSPALHEIERELCMEPTKQLIHRKRKDSEGIIVIMAGIPENLGLNYFQVRDISGIERVIAMKKQKGWLKVKEAIREDLRKGIIQLEDKGEKVVISGERCKDDYVKMLRDAFPYTWDEAREIVTKIINEIWEEMKHDRLWYLIDNFGLGGLRVAILEGLLEPEPPP